jgi:hypothetical protein
MRVSFRIPHPAYFGLRFGLVGSRNSLAKSVTPADSNLGRLGALDATPALSGFGQYLAHFFDWMMDAAVVAESSFRHQFF